MTMKRLRNPIEVEDVEGAPGEPRGQAAQLQAGDFGDRSGAADDGHAALVEVAEGGRGAAGETLPDRAGDVAALLHRDRGNARQRLAALVREEGEVSDHEDVGMSGHREVGLHDDPAVLVDGSAEEAADAGGRDARGPENGARVEPAVRPATTPAVVHRGDRLAGADLDAEAAELRARVLAMTAAE